MQGSPTFARNRPWHIVEISNLKIMFVFAERRQLLKRTQEPATVHMSLYLPRAVHDAVNGAIPRCAMQPLMSGKSMT